MPKNKKETLNFNAEVGKLLQLLAKSLYPNREIFIREVVSNSSDAIEKARFAFLSNSLDDHPLDKDTMEQMASFSPRINITRDKDANILCFEDNGIGMSRTELIENLGTLARSGTQQFLEKIKDQENNLIGQFGIGFYSAYMVSEKVVVDSAKLGTHEAWRWESDGSGSFDISKVDVSMDHGTKVSLYLKQDAAEEFLDYFKIESVIGRYANHIRFPIMLQSDKGEMEKINDATAIWTKDKSQVAQEEHSDFFKSVAHVGGPPWLILHNKNEGKDVNFINLLYIPSIRPFDLFHPDRKCNVQLYVKSVFITEDGDRVELLPRYMRFVKGVVDSDDLPLNINRDSLQQSHKINTIRSSLTKRILTKLKEIAESQEEKYKEFWNNFGSVLKEGLCEAMDTESRERLLDVCRFASTTHKFTSIADYLSRAADHQKPIYYLIGDNLDTMMKSPQLEGFIKNDVEVLLLVDSVDDFWTHVIFEYKDHEFKSVTNADVSFNSEDNKQDDGKQPAEDPSKEEDDNFDKFATYVQEVIGSSISKVVASKKLTTSPACLAIADGSFNMRMERFLIDQKQLDQRRPKILEINREHPVILKMIARFEHNRDDSELREHINLLHDCVCITEGEPIQDMTAYSKRTIDLLSKVA